MAAPGPWASPGTWLHQRRHLMGKIAIHGFGRIGRTLQRIGLARNLFTAAAISDIKDAPTLAALFQVDTNYGLWAEPVEADAEGFRIGGRAIPYFNTQKE